MNGQANHQTSVNLAIETAVFLQDNDQQVFIVLSNHLLEQETQKIKDALKCFSEQLKVVKIVGKQEILETLTPLFDSLVVQEFKKTARSSGNLIYDRGSHRLFLTKMNEKKEQKIKKVIVIDDSPTIAKIIRQSIESLDGYQVVATVLDPREAEGELAKHQPDLITVDINMPHMNGVELIHHLRPKFAVPSIIVTSLNIHDSEKVLEGMHAGAFDYIEKPAMEHLSDFKKELHEKMELAVASNYTPSQPKPVQGQATFLSTDFLLCIGSSTGGTQALQTLFSGFPAEIPPTLVVQHIPAVFSKSLANRLDSLMPFEVVEGEDGMEITPNRVIIAAGGKQMRFVNKETKTIVSLTDDEPVNRFKPSVDYLFQSIATSTWQKPIVSVMLTGMGNDGAKGMHQLKLEKGAHTIAQDEESSVVFGMPKAAIQTGSVDHISSLEKIPHTIGEITKNLINLKKAG